MNIKLKGAFKNSDFFVNARKLRAQSRSVYRIHEDSSTELTQQSRKKCIFRGALTGFDYFVLLGGLVNILIITSLVGYWLLY